MFTPIIIDFEASGFGKNSYPIEVGFVSDHGNSWCSLIKPEDDWQHWDEAAASVHRIPRSTLIEYGKSAAEVALELNELLHNKVVYSDGWTHDFIWMARLFDAANTAPHFKMEDLRNILSKEQEAHWHQIKQEVQIELRGERHRASVDAKVLQLTWERTQQLERVVAQ